MLPCTKSERIKQAKKLLLCYSSSKPQAVYPGGLWEGVVINLSRNIHQKAKSLHSAWQKKYFTIRGHHCCMQNWVKSICSSWNNWLFAVKLWDVGSGCSQCGVHPVSKTCRALAKLPANSTWAIPGQVPWGWQEITESKYFLLNLHVTWICLWCL